MGWRFGARLNSQRPVASISRMSFCQATEEGDVDAFEIRPDGRHRAAAGNGVNDELPVRFRFGDTQDSAACE